MTNDAVSETSQETIEQQVEQLWNAISQFRRVTGSNFKRARRYGLGATQFIVLVLMERAEHAREAEETEAEIDSGPCTISWLANQLDLDPATVVRTVDSLEKRGLVMRRRDSQDRRQVFVEFTPEGRATRQELQQRIKARLMNVVSAMSEEGRTNLLTGLQEFIRIGLQEDFDASPE